MIYFRLPDKIQFMLIVGVTIYDSSSKYKTELFQEAPSWVGCASFDQPFQLLRLMSDNAKVIPPCALSPVVILRPVAFDIATALVLLFIEVVLFLYYYL
ncbi:hypothetical protein [Dyadobacter soli]|uniref:hypothetical protein n=1 Tax=Dyadobacter soli TaxID=659014 RepID=UPI000B7EBC04|nr:hypothetical protein [Dyadobacter soli]